MRLPLTDEQKRAATTASNRAYIEAVPGAGKTTVAAERYGVSRFAAFGHGRGVLALSFARSARGELHDRVQRRWGTNSMRWPHKVWTLDHLHCAIVQHFLGAGLLAWPGEHKRLEVVDSWRGHQGSWWREAGTYRRGIYVHEGKVAIGGGSAGPGEYAFTAISPYRKHLENGLCTHAEIRQVLTSVLRTGSPLQASVSEFLTNTVSSLIVDEVFDGNSLDLRIVHGAAAAGIATTLIGDPWQALYAFRGAQPQLVPQLIGDLEFQQYPISQSFRFGTASMQTLAAMARAGQAVTVPNGTPTDCDVLLASEWARLWNCSDHVLPLSFGQASNRVDAAIALLLDRAVTQRFESLSTFGIDAAVLLGLDLDVFRNHGSAQLAPVLSTLAGGTEHDARAAFAMLRNKLVELGSKNIPNLQAQNMKVRFERLVALSRRLAVTAVVPGLTVHQAKGREWRRVGIVLSDAERHRLEAGLAQENEGDRRLYVALTRAKESTTLVG